MNTIRIQDINDTTRNRQSGKKMIVLNSECFKNMTVQTSGREAGIPTIFLEQPERGIASLKFYGFDEYQILYAYIIQSTLSVALGTRPIKR